MTDSDRLVGMLVVEHDVKIDDANTLIDLFDEVDWKHPASMRRLRRKAKELLGNDRGAVVFGRLRREGAESSQSA